jgi:putative heme degradation protein
MDHMVRPLEDLPAIGGEPGEEAVPLLASPGTLAGKLPDLGPVRARLFSGSLRHTVTTTLGELERDGALICLRGDGSDLRLDPRRWHGGCAVTRYSGADRREGIRFVGPDLDSGLMVDLTPESSRSAFADMVAGDTTPTVHAGSGSCLGERRGSPFAVLSAVEVGLVRELLETVADAAIPVRLETAVSGARQGVTGIIANPVSKAGTLWVQGAGFRLELPVDRVADARVRVQRVGEGRVHCVDLLDGTGRCLLCLSGQPVAGRPEDGAWRTLVRALTATERGC